jgi:iron(III) transport system substrate-binding protein
MRNPAVAVLAAVIGLSLLASPAGAEGGHVNLYSYRQPFLMKPLLDAFTRKTGITVNMVYAKTGMLERLKAEGRNSPADAVLTADVGRLTDLVRAGLVQPVASAVLSANIPPQYRHPDGLWFGLTTRARVIYADKTRVKPGEVSTYEDLADPRFKGRVCTRSGKHAYNISLLASFIAAKGEKAAEAWARAVKSNLARRPQGNDRAQVRAIKEGECDVALGNSYYMGKMATNAKKPEQKAWAAAATIIFPNQPRAGRPGGDSLGRGTHVNLSGAAVTKSAKNRDNAIRLLEFLSGDFAQRIYAEQNFEYPVKSGVPLHPLVASWGTFKADTVHLTEVAKYRAVAAKIMDRVAFDH